MAWTIEFVPAAAKELKKLGRAEAARIVGTLETRIAARDNPRELGSALGGELGGLWRWRIGDYRVVARIEDERITIFVVRIAHMAGGVLVSFGDSVNCHGNPTVIPR